MSFSDNSSSKNFLLKIFPKLFLLFLLILYLNSTFNYINYFKEKELLPSPLFGGDYYYQLGQINFMYSNPPEKWFSSSNGIGKLPGYFPAYGILVTLFGKLLGLSPLYAMYYFNFLVIPFSLLFSYFLAKQISKNELIAISFTSLFSLKVPAFIFKYTEFSSIFSYPFFLFSLYYFFDKRNLISSLLLAFSTAFLSLSHGTGFLIAFGSLIISALLVYLKERETPTLNHSLKLFGLSFSLAFLFSLLYWFEPIFVYKFSSGLKSYIWSLPDYANLRVGFETLLQILSFYFFNFSSPLGALFSLSVFFLVFKLLSLKISLSLNFLKELKEKELFLIASFIPPFFGTFSYLITAPLFDFHILPTYVNSIYLSTIIILISSLNLENLKDKLPYIALILALASLLNAYSLYDENNPLFQYIDEFEDGGIIEASQEIKALTSPNSVILSNKELSFAINALTGRKLVISRRAQNDAFIQNFDEIEKDVAIILYGNNLSKRIELIKKYNITHFFYSNLWSFFEFRGNTPADPLMIVYREDYEKELKENGVKYVVDYFFLDPAIRGKDVRRFKVIIITPENYDFNGFGIWNSEIDVVLNPLFIKLQNSSITQTPIVNAFYEVNYNSPLFKS